VWNPGNPSAANPAWVAINIGSGYSRLLLNWTSTFNYNYNETTYGGPGDYQVQTSGDSTNGADGTWTTVANVSGNYVRARAHTFDFTGKSWVRLLVTAPSATTNGNGVAIDEIDIHDVSNGIADTWFFMGDSITAGGFTRKASQQPSFAANINQMHPSYFPAMINGGIGGETSGSAVGHIDTWLQLNPDMKYWALAYGTNDAAGNNGNPAAFKANMQILIDRIKAAGRVPILAKIPYAIDGNHNTIPLFNQAIDELNTANGLMSGPDLYAWFQAHPEQLSSDGLHPNDAGSASINRLWAEAMSGLYH
jgi:lysophospholipase L1-like esterase